MAKQAAKRERTVKFSVILFTDGLAQPEGWVEPKHAWDVGVVSAVSNKTHGIKRQSPTPFHSLDDVVVALKKQVERHGIQVHSAKRKRSK